MYLFKKQTLLTVGFLLALTACGGGGGDDGETTTAATPSCTIGTSTLGDCKI